MLEEQLKQIYEKQLQYDAFYTEQLKPEIDKVLRAENPQAELVQLQKRLIGTPFESINPKLAELSRQQQLTSKQLEYQLLSVMTDAINKQNAKQARTADGLLGSGAPSLKLNPSAAFYAAAIYNHQAEDDLESLQKARRYAEIALEQTKLKPQLNLSQRISKLYGFIDNRWQIAQAQLNLKLIAQKQRALEQQTQNEKEQQRVTNAKKQAMQLTPIPSMKLKKKDEPTIIQCSNCGGKGHIAGACMKPRKP